MSLNIDMKIILPSNCSGSHCRSFINFWISWRRPNVVIPGNVIHSNSIGSPSIRFKSFTWLLSKYHLIFSFQASFRFFFFCTSQTEHRVGEDVGLDIRDLIDLVTQTCRAPFVLFVINHWYPNDLCLVLEYFYFLWKTSSNNTRNDSQ